MMVRLSNGSQASGPSGPPARAAVPETGDGPSNAPDLIRRRHGPRRPPGGRDDIADLLRDPSLLLGELVSEQLARRGFADLRPALLAVGRHVRAEGSRVTELAERTLLTKATVVHTVDELVRLGYVRRVPDPTDGRAKLVVPTERAVAAERAAREAIAQVRGAWAQLIGEDELERLETSLHRLRSALWPAT